MLRGDGPVRDDPDHTRAEEMGRLPAEPDHLLGHEQTGGRMLVGLLLVLVSAAFAWSITAGAWDDTGFMPWYWNVIWTVFPWLFLIPAWIAYFVLWLGAKGKSDRRAAYGPFAATAHQVEGGDPGRRHHDLGAGNGEHARRLGGVLRIR